MKNLKEYLTIYTVRSVLEGGSILAAQGAAGSLGMVQAGVNLLCPDWVRFRSALRVGIGAINHRRCVFSVNQSVFSSPLVTGLTAIIRATLGDWSGHRTGKWRPGRRSTKEEWSEFC